MPATNQWAVSTLIREVLADPDLAHDEVFRRLLQAGLQDLVDAEAAAVIGAQRYERTPERTNRRNGKRLKTVATTAGEVELAIPELRTGSFFPSLLHPRRRVDKALYAVICSAWIEGVSTRKVDDLVKALGNESGISRSTVSRICKDIDEGVKEFLARRLDHTWFPYLFVDATYLDVRAGRRVVCRALVVATGVSAQGRREIPEHGPGRRRDHGLLDLLPAVPARTRPQGPLTPRPRGRGPGLPVTPTPASAPPSGPSRPGPPGSAAAPRFARNITTRARPGPHPSPRAPWSRPSSPPPAGRPSWPSTSTSSTLQGTPSLQNRPDADRRPAGPNSLRHDPSPASTGPRSGRSNPIERLNREIKRRADVAPGPPRQRLRTPPDRPRPARATRSGSTANADTSPRPHCDT